MNELYMQCKDNNRWDNEIKWIIKTIGTEFIFHYFIKFTLDNNNRVYKITNKGTGS